jgi:hypothetical protein
MAGGLVAGRLGKSFTSRVLVPVVAVTLSAVLLAVIGALAALG